MQILALAIYNRSGDRRVIPFKPGKVNIITGAPKTGKTALIDIVDYCLGRVEYTVPEGRIRENVVWYVLHVQMATTQAVIGRPAPQGTDTTSDVFLDVGSNLSLPEFTSLRRTTNTDALSGFLAEQIGITANENIPPEGQSRLPLQADIKHARLLLYQPQFRIAARDLMFYRQDEPFMPQTIKDTLPYLLGASGDDQLARMQTLRLARRELRLLQRRFAEAEAIKGNDSSRALALVAEAQNVGLVSADAADYDEAVSLLSSLASWTPATDEAAPSARLAELRRNRAALLDEYRSVQSDIETAREFSTAQSEFSTEATDQKDRLTAIGLYTAEPHGNSCPLCESDLGEAVPQAELIRRNLGNLDRQIGTASRQRPRLEAYVREKEELLSQFRQRLTENKAGIEALVAQEEVLRRERDRTTEQARVVGRASLFVESLNVTEEDGLQRSVAEAKERVASLEAELSEEIVEDRLNSILQLIGIWMTAWAKHLRIEHSEWPFGFDLKNLTAVAFRDEGPLRMNRMGSASNWLLCHLITHLALQKWFVEKQRPVPSFLMFDQPTQAYFPSDAQQDRSVDTLDDDDREAVKRMFRFILDVVKELSPNLQVIITDHADLNEDWYQEAVVEKWHGGLKLVPESWYQ
ncbi:MAG: DUF3732 domain-containing protein [Planctomycetota bacterium]|nr:DUF3732 domain-containing protein [Planctomycetota bacterium]